MPFRDNSDQPATVLKFTDAFWAWDRVAPLSPMRPRKGAAIMALTDDILYLTVRELGDRIRTRQLSSVELTEAYLDRCKKFGPQLNAFATLTPDLALQQARPAEAEIAAGHYRGPLHGIPYAAKDLLAVKGYPTTWGAKPYFNQHFDYNATVINKLDEAGAVLLGKAAMIEFGRRHELSVTPRRRTQRRRQESLEHQMLDLRLVERFGRNRGRGDGGFRDWHRDWGLHCLSLGLLRRLRLASDLRTRRPRGAMALSYSMDKIGPMCRSAEDCSLVPPPLAVTTSVTPAPSLNRKRVSLTPLRDVRCASRRSTAPGRSLILISPRRSTGIGSSRADGR